MGFLQSFYPKTLVLIFHSTRFNSNWFIYKKSNSKQLNLWRCITMYLIMRERERDPLIPVFWTPCIKCLSLVFWIWIITITLCKSRYSAKSGRVIHRKFSHIKTRNHIWILSPRWVIKNNFYLVYYFSVIRMGCK